MIALLLLVAGPSLALSAFLVAEAVTEPGRAREALLRRVSRYGPRPATRASANTRLRRLTAPLARLALLLAPRTNVDSVARELRAAGLAPRTSVDDVLAARVAASALGLGAGALIGTSVGTARGIVAAAALAVLGYLSVSVPLRLLARRRRARIAPALPDALDLLCVCVEAGLGLDAALQKVTAELHGPLADEFELTLAEMRIGVARQQALENLVARTNVPELAVVVNAILLADRQGSPLGRTLTIQAAESRTRRQIAAENEANKAPVKMLFPTALLIFPALFIVVLGPALLTIADSL
jgi:tight adherence protein C